MACPWVLSSPRLGGFDPTKVAGQDPLAHQANAQTGEPVFRRVFSRGPRTSCDQATRADASAVNVSGLSAGISGVAAAQGAFDGAVQQAAGGSVPSVAVSAAAAAEAVQVTLLQKSLEMERSVVNIFA